MPDNGRPSTMELERHCTVVVVVQMPTLVIRIDRTLRSYRFAQLALHIAQYLVQQQGELVARSRLDALGRVTARRPNYVNQATYLVGP